MTPPPVDVLLTSKLRAAETTDSPSIDDMRLPIQSHSLPPSPMAGEGRYLSQVLGLEIGTTEQELDGQLLRTALDLGIDLPKAAASDSPKAFESSASSESSAPTLINSSPPSPSTVPSCHSQSTQTTSVDSLEQHLGMRLARPRVAKEETPSIVSPPVLPAVVSREKPYDLLRKGFRRLSTFRRKASSNEAMMENRSGVGIASYTSMAPASVSLHRKPIRNIASIPAMNASRQFDTKSTKVKEYQPQLTYHSFIASSTQPVSARRPDTVGNAIGSSHARSFSNPAVDSFPLRSSSRPATLSHYRTGPINFSRPPALTPRPPSPTRSLPPMPCSTPIRNFTTFDALAYLDEEEEEEEEEEESPLERVALARSIASPALQSLRKTHLAEQSRFIAFRASTVSTLRSLHTQGYNELVTVYKGKEAALRSRHEATNAELENRQLGAEVDLVRTLEAEMRTCEVRLKHMTAYCSPSDHAITRSSDSPTTPSSAHSGRTRTVTQHNRRALLHQHHLLAGMPALHLARVNVLREKQAKQSARVLACQEEEIEALHALFATEMKIVTHQQKVQHKEWHDEWEARRSRLARRWVMKEAILRGRLCREDGRRYGELPALDWPEAEDLDGDVDVDTDE